MEKKLEKLPKICADGHFSNFKQFVILRSCQSTVKKITLMSANDVGRTLSSLMKKLFFLYLSMQQSQKLTSAKAHAPLAVFLNVTECS